jgi:hypothetical protein
MKKTTIYLMMTMLSLSAFPSQMIASEKDPTTISANEIPADVQIKLARLNEIDTMDKSNLNRSEKRALRKEVKAINASLASSGNGVYLSVGAIILIVVLLIILL